MATTNTNPYTRQSMDDAVRIFRDPITFMSDMFFSRVRVEPSPSILFDIVNGGRTTGAYVGKRDKAIPVDRALFNTKTLTPPLLSFSRTITGVDLERRQPGRNPFEGGDGAAEIQAQDYQDLLNVIKRAEELQAAQAIVSDSVALLDINGNNIDGSAVSYGRDSALTPAALAGNNVWGGTTSDPLGNLRSLAQLVQDYGDVMADVIVMRTSLYNTFAADTHVQAQLDVRRGPDTDLLTFKAMGLGAVYRGMIDGMRLYTYDGSYKAPGSDTLAYYIPANKVIVGSTQNEGTRYYAQIFSAEAGGMVTTDLLPESFSPSPCRKSDGILLRAQACGLLVPRRVNAVAVRQVVA